MLIEMATYGEDESGFAKEVLANERSITWVHDPLQYPYLREMDGLYLEPEHLDPGFGSLKLIGYGVVEQPVGLSTGKQPLYRRRSWWFHHDDPYPQETAFPTEAVIPRYIRQSKPSPLGKDCGADRIIYIERTHKGGKTLMVLHPDGSRNPLHKDSKIC